MNNCIKQVYVLIMAIAMIIAFTPMTGVYAASRTTTTVSNQKQLTRALKNKSIKGITISTSKKVSLTISKGNYKNKNITVKGKKLTVTNKGKTGKIHVSSARKFVQQGDTPTINDSADDSYLILQHGSDTDKVVTNGNDIRIADDAPTDINANDSINAKIDNGAENTDVTLNDQGKYSSVVNTSDSKIDLDVDDSANKLAPGDVYSATKEGSGTSNVDEDIPLRNYSGMVKCGALSLEIHGCGEFGDLSSGNRIHGWYHNLTTDTDYECFFVVNGSNITAEHIDNENYEKNYRVDATFTIKSTDESSMTIVSTSDAYEDNGAEYTLYYNDNSSDEGDISDDDSGLDEGNGDVDASNPLKIFSGSVSSFPLSLEIHGCGALAYMSHGNRIHGWYNSEKTKSSYECWFIVDGTTITTEKIDNPNYTKNYLGNASFEITEYTNKSVTLKSTNGVYDDEGATYTFRTLDESDSVGDVAAENPLKMFSGKTSDGNVSMEIHGCGAFAYMSHGNKIHGWYYNSSTNTAYETWMLVDGSKIYCTYISNPNYESHYLGDAEFEILGSDSNSVTLKSTNNTYGDEGTEYTFKVN